MFAHLGGIAELVGCGGERAVRRVALHSESLGHSRRAILNWLVLSIRSSGHGCEHGCEWGANLEPIGGRGTRVRRKGPFRIHRCQLSPLCAMRIVSRCRGALEAVAGLVGLPGCCGLRLVGAWLGWVGVRPPN